MQNILVTYKQNVTFHDDGTFDLKNPDQIGHLVKIHTIQVNTFNEETRQIVTGVVTRGEIYWEHKREIDEPLQDLTDLVWLTFSDDLYDDEEEEEEIDNLDEDEDEVHRLPPVRDVSVPEKWVD